MELESMPECYESEVIHGVIASSVLRPHPSSPRASPPLTISPVIPAQPPTSLVFLIVPPQNYPRPVCLEWKEGRKRWIRG
ncbi:hypothetical protein E2C01_067313 [Portunus trituberculatus]|uniref:Uncharacterized protein n=1 Tax=Portunus trituberculatus TaxID=210409 RepID=A0A5B7HUP6_PORTR|nr:hypothetical protein [Portunus trituberculatus]